MAELIAATLRGLGVDARVGEVPGEYCPGAYSVNARGAVKLSGIGQRMIRGGAHMGGVVVASGGRGGGPGARAGLRGARAGLGPRDLGSVSEELGREVDPGEIEEALIAELGRAYELVDAELDEETMRRPAGPAGRLQAVKLLAFSDLHRDLDQAERLVERSPRPTW